MDLREIFRVLMRRKLMLALPWLVAIAAGVAAAYLLPPVYFSAVSMSFEAAPISNPFDNIVPDGNPKQMAEFMRRQLQKSSFLRTVIARSGVIADPVTRAQGLAVADRYPHLASDDEKIEAFMVDHLREGRIMIRSDRGFFEVTIGDDRPDRAQILAHTISNLFVELSKAGQLEVVRAQQRFYERQRDSLKVIWDAKQAQLERFERAGVGREGGLIHAGNVVGAQSMLERAGIDVEEKQRRVTSLATQLGADRSEASKLSGGEVRALVEQLKGLERQMVSSQLGTGNDGGNTGEVQQLIARNVADIERALAAEAGQAFRGTPPDKRDRIVQLRLAQLDLEAKRARREHLAQLVARFQQVRVSAPDRDNEQVQLRREVDRAREDFLRANDDWAKAKLGEEMVNEKLTGRFEILEEATFPRKPGKPNKLMLILLAVVVGGLIGVGSVLVAEQHDESVKTAEDVESLLGLPVLGAIPRVDELQRSRRRRGNVPKLGPVVGGRDGLIQRLKVESPLGLEFRRLYLKLAKSHGRSMPRTLLVTSSTRAEGKTTTSACLGITLGRELREKVLLVDFDLRSPSLHRALGLPGSSWGLAHILKQRKFDERFVRSTVLPHLDFLPAGRSERPVGELIDSDNVEWFLRDVRERYAWVLIDSAPTLAVPDPLILGRAVEGVLYVIKAGATMRKAAEYGVRVQREARDNLLGILLNDAGDVLPHYYGYHDAYGYSSEEAGGVS